MKKTTAKQDQVELKHRKGTWLRFIKLFPKCRLPWILLALYLVLDIGLINLGVDETDYTSLMYYNGELFYIAGLMDTKEEVYQRKRGMDIPDEDLHFENVSFSYGEAPVLRDVSFTIPKGKVTMLTGPNGSGKMPCATCRLFWQTVSFRALIRKTWSRIWNTYTPGKPLWNGSGITWRSSLLHILP